jgi:precorrin-2 methylase
VLPQRVIDWLPRDIAPKVESSWSEYARASERLAAYKAEVDRTLRLVESIRPVACLAQGHPLVFDSVCERVMVEGERRGLNVMVVPGVSSIGSNRRPVENPHRPRPSDLRCLVDCSS